MTSRRAVEVARGRSSSRHPVMAGDHINGISEIFPCGMPEIWNTGSEPGLPAVKSHRARPGIPWKEVSCGPVKGCRGPGLRIRFLSVLSRACSSKRTGTTWIRRRSRVRRIPSKYRPDLLLRAFATRISRRQRAAASRMTTDRDTPNGERVSTMEWPAFSALMNSYLAITGAPRRRGTAFPGSSFSSRSLRFSRLRAISLASFSPAPGDDATSPDVRPISGCGVVDAELLGCVHDRTRTVRCPAGSRSRLNRRPRPVAVPPSGSSATLVGDLSGKPGHLIGGRRGSE